MREPIRDKERLLHIVDAIDTILERTQGMSYHDLVEDKLIFGGIVYYTMIIGEASYKLSQMFKSTFTDTNWPVIANMRHHLVHGYYQVNPEDVWGVIQNDLKPLREQVVRYITGTNWNEWENQSTEYK